MLWWYWNYTGNSSWRWSWRTSWNAAVPLLYTTSIWSLFLQECKQLFQRLFNLRQRVSYLLNPFFQAFMLDEWEVCSYETIPPSLPVAQIALRSHANFCNRVHSVTKGWFTLESGSKKTWRPLDIQYAS